MKFGYARSFNDDQNLDYQLKKLNEVGCNEIYIEKIVGARDSGQFSRMINQLKNGDKLYVVKLDRLGKDIKNLVRFIIKLKTNGVDLIVTENNIDTSKIDNINLFCFLKALADMEHDLVREKIRFGLESAKKNGRKGGRPKKITSEKKILIQTMRQSNLMSVNQICKNLGISRSAFYRSLANNKD